MRIEEVRPTKEIFSSTIDLDELAIQQGVQPIKDIDELAGDFWPEEEDIEDFLSALREWRNDGRAENAK